MIDEFLITFQRGPESFELTGFQKRGVIQNASEGVLFAVHPTGFDETFAHDQVRVREIRQRFEEDLTDRVLVVISRVELVQFENGQIGL